MSDGEQKRIGSTVGDKPTSVKDRIKAARNAALAALDNKKFTGDATQKWLDNMNQSLTKAEQTMKVATKPVVEKTSMIELFDSLFNLFDRYAIEYNNNPPVEGMTLTLVKPSGVREKLDFNFGVKTYIMHGHVTGQHFAMVVYGENNLVSIYMIPSDFILGFQPDRFDPYVHIEGQPGEEKCSWTVVDKIIGSEELPEFARRLIGHLVTVGVGRSEPDRKFKWSVSEQEFKPKPATPDRSFESDNAPLLQRDED